MDITNENFLQLLPEITEAITDCDFIAIDTELSGLLRQQRLNRFDLPDERFARDVESSRGYFILQFGLSCFKCLGGLNYANRTYNFYIFPQPLKHGDINRTYSLQAHAIQFLCQHGFDFNKLFRQGVSYLTFQEKKLLTAQLKNDMKQRAKVQIGKNGLPDFVPSPMTNYCLESIKRLNKFIDQQSKMETDEIPKSLDGDGVSNGESVKKADRSRFELRDCSNNHTRAVLKRVFECLPIGDNLQVEYARDAETEENYLVVNYLGKGEKNSRLKDELTQAKGFLEVIELMIVNKKPLVGHNLSLDLIQIINQFMEQLGDDYGAYKETCHTLFPIIYDSKHIAHQILDVKTLQNNQSRLNDLYCQLKESEKFPKIKVTHTGKCFDEDQMAHQAGYDAYMSGYSFIALCEAYLEANKSKKYKTDRSEPLPMQQQLIDEFSNKIHLPYSHDIKCIDLGGDEQVPDRSHVFYVEFPSSWSLEDLFQLFYQYGGVDASRLNKTSALCALRDPKQRSRVIQKMRNAQDTYYKIYTYDEYRATLNPRKKRPANDDSDDVDSDRPDMS